MKQNIITFTASLPLQVLQGAFDHQKNRYRQFIPVPLKFERHCDLSTQAHNIACELAGEGKVIWEEEGTERRRYLLLIENGNHTGRRYSMPPGDWIIEYVYERENGVEGTNLFLGAQLQ